MVRRKKKTSGRRPEDPVSGQAAAGDGLSLGAGDSRPRRMIDDQEDGGAQVSAEQVDDPEREYLCFRVKSRRYAVLLSDVVEVVNPTRITAVPHTPDYIRGVFSRHGRTTVMLDLATFMGTEVEDAPRRLIILAAGPLEAAVPASDIVGIISLPQNQVESSQPHLAHGSGIITGQITRGEVVFSVIQAVSLLENTRSRKRG